MLGVGYYLSASEWDTSLGMGYPFRRKRVAILIPAQTIWGTRVEKPQVENGVEVRVREVGIRTSYRNIGVAVR